MTCLGSPYEFNAERLAETTERDGVSYYDWPVHMASKTWVDIDAFIEAFSKALEIHAGRYSERIDPDMLDASYEYARRIARQRYNAKLP